MTNVLFKLFAPLFSILLVFNSYCFTFGADKDESYDRIGFFTSISGGYGYQAHTASFFYGKFIDMNSSVFEPLEMKDKKIDNVNTFGGDFVLGYIPFINDSSLILKSLYFSFSGSYYISKENFKFVFGPKEKQFTAQDNIMNAILNIGTSFTYLDFCVGGGVAYNSIYGENVIKSFEKIAPQSTIPIFDGSLKNTQAILQSSLKFKYPVIRNQNLDLSVFLMVQGSYLLKPNDIYFAQPSKDLVVQSSLQTKNNNKLFILGSAGVEFKF